MKSREIPAQEFEPEPVVPLSSMVGPGPMKTMELGEVQATLHGAGAEIDRLQRRVVELEHERTMSADAAEGHLAVLVRTQKEAAEQRKRAEEAEARFAVVVAELRNYELNGSNAPRQIRDIYSDLEMASAGWRDAVRGRAAAIEKARQEERERCAQRLEAAVGADTLCGRNEVLRGMAAELRALESES